MWFREAIVFQKDVWIFNEDRCLCSYVWRLQMSRESLKSDSSVQVVTSKSEVREGWQIMLSSSVDGREVSIPEVDKASHEWLCHAARVFPRLYIRGIQLRGELLPIKARRARGNNRQVTVRTCRGACCTPETQNHILQVCDLTHDTCCA